MPRATRPPSRAELAARPTILSTDQFADRAVRQNLSDSQLHPEGDNRHRVERSAKFYVVQLIGTWINIVESAERVVRSRNNLRWVTFEANEYELRKADAFKPFVARFIQGGCYAYVGGKHIQREKDLAPLISFPFIYISSTAALQLFNNMRQTRLANSR